MLGWIRTNTNESPYISEQRVRYSYGESYLALAAIIYTNCFLAYLYYEVNASSEVLVWLSSVMIIAISRIILTHNFWKKVDHFEQEDFLYWENTYFYLTILNAAAIGVGYFYFWPQEHYHIQILNITFCAGYVCGAVANYASTPKIPFYYSLVLLSSLFVSEVFYGQNIEDLFIASAMVLFVIVMVKTLKKNYQNIIDLLKLKVEAQELAEDLKKTNKNLMKTQKEVVDQQKMAVIGVMSAGVAHEINNPLAIISGYSNKLSRDFGKILQSLQGHETEEKIKLMKNKFDKVEVASSRIAGIIKGLKTLSRDGSYDDFKQENLKDMIEDTQNIIEGSLRNAKIDIHIDNIPKGHILNCRAVQICQVFANLLINAKDAIVEKNSEERWIKVRYIYKRDKCEILIIDSGAGVPQAVADKIMTPFFTTKDVGEGTGLGLSISKKIIEEHGGRLSLLPEKENTTFKIELPIEVQHITKIAA